jgi:hypothetical protein
LASQEADLTITHIVHAQQSLGDVVKEACRQHELARFSMVSSGKAFLGECQSSGLLGYV